MGHITKKNPYFDIICFSSFIRVRKRVQNIFVFLICTQEKSFPFTKSNGWQGDEKETKSYSSLVKYKKVVKATNIMFLWKAHYYIHAAGFDLIKKCV